jgi:hypothetical protein
MWALDTLAGQVKAGELTGARERAGTLASFWNAVAGGEQPRGLVAKALKVAQDLDEPELASMLLAPLRAEMLTRTHATALGRIADTYGEQWSGEIVGTWFGRDRLHSSGWTPDRAAWAQSLPSLCEPLHAAGEGGASMSRLLVAATWKSLKKSVAAGLGTSQPSQRERHLTQAGPAIAAVLCATAVNADTDQRDQMIAFLVQDNQDLITAVLSVLRAGANHPADDGTPTSTPWRRTAGARLSARLARPQRAADDWSIELPAGCTCPLCAELGAFLADPCRRSPSGRWPSVSASMSTSGSTHPSCRCGMRPGAKAARTPDPDQDHRPARPRERSAPPRRG